MTSGDAVATVVDALASDVDRFVAAEPDVRADVPDSVHSMRVAARRLRSVLRTYRKIFDRARVDDLRTELKWFGGVLGSARDGEVNAMLFADLLDGVKPDLVIGPIRDRLVTAQRARYAVALTQVHAEFDADRYRALHRAVVQIPAETRSPDTSAGPAATVLAGGLSREYRRLRNNIHAEFSAPADARIAALHEVRKSAKRLRYAAETAQPVLDPSAQRIAQSAKALQSLLGDHRDAVQAQQLVLETSDAARTAGEDMFTYGVVHMSLAHSAADAIARYPAALESLSVACAALDS